jgi:hydrogenase-4 component F
MPIILILATPLIASGLSFLIRKKIGVLNFIAVLASALELLAAIAIVLAVIKNGSYSLINIFSADYLGAIVMLTLAVTGFPIAIYSVGYLKAELAKGVIDFHKIKQYFILFHLFILAMFFAILTTSSILMWVAIEATTLSTAFLISFYKKPSAIEAAWKYLIMNSLGLLLAFFGTLLFLYPALNGGHHELITWRALLASGSAMDPFIAKMAFIFVLIGYGTKVGFVPMHTWRPDAYSKTPVPVVALFSGSLLNVAFLAILRFKLVSDSVVGKEFSQNLFIFFGLASIIVAAFSIFAQKNYKRLLAYSSIEHAGIMALGFGFGGIGAFAALLHMVYHALAKSMLFLSAGNIFLKYSSTKIKNIRGIMSVIPVTGALFFLGFLAITGVPPFGIFITEFSILSAGIVNHPFVTIIALLGVGLVFIGFLKHIISMMFGEKDQNITPGEASAWLVVPVIFLAAVLLIASFVVPSAIKDLIHSATLPY